MAETGLEIPKVELRVSDKFFIGVFLLVQAASFIGASALPTDTKTAIIWSCLLISNVGMALLLRLVPTPKQAGAERIAARMIKHVEEAQVVEEITGKPVALTTDTLKAIVRSAPDPKAPPVADPIDPDDPDGPPPV